MSNDVSAACRTLQMPPTAKAVLMAMADYADDSGFCWPSIAGLCEYTCFGKSAVIEAIKHLEQIGVVVADRKDRYQTTYTVHPDRFPSSGLVHKHDMSGRRTSPSSGGLVRLAENEVRQPENEVRETDTNHQEPSRTTNKATTKKRADALPCPDDVAEQTWSDWLALRKAKKAPVTETVLKQARGEARKAGMALDAFLAIWCARGSQGLQADWLKPHERAGPVLTSVSPTASPPSKTLSAIQTLQGLKNGKRVDSQRDSGRAEPVALLEPGSHPGGGHDRWNGDGVVSGSH